MTATNEKQQPAKYYRVIFGGCQHTGIMSEQDLNNPVEQQFNAEKLHKENVYVCGDCGAGKPGFCMSSTLHPILTATKLTPLDRKRL